MSVGRDELPEVSWTLPRIVHLYNVGLNYGTQAVGMAQDFINQVARRAKPRIYDAYV